MKEKARERERDHWCPTEKGGKRKGRKERERKRERERERERDHREKGQFMSIIKRPLFDINKAKNGIINDKNGIIIDYNDINYKNIIQRWI